MRSVTNMSMNSLWKETNKLFRYVRAACCKISSLLPEQKWRSDKSSMAQRCSRLFTSRLDIATTECAVPHSSQDDAESCIIPSFKPYKALECRGVIDDLKLSQNNSKAQKHEYGWSPRSLAHRILAALFLHSNTCDSVTLSRPLMASRVLLFCSNLFKICIRYPFFELCLFWKME